jgi:hypothetical protein
LTATAAASETPEWQPQTTCEQRQDSVAAVIYWNKRVDIVVIIIIIDEDDRRLGCRCCMNLWALKYMCTQNSRFQRKETKRGWRTNNGVVTVGEEDENAGVASTASAMAE